MKLEVLDLDGKMPSGVVGAFKNIVPRCSLTIQVPKSNF